MDIQPMAIVNVVKLTMLVLVAENHEDIYIPLIEVISIGDPFRRGQGVPRDFERIHRGTTGAVRASQGGEGR
jgi:hypothetical protein